MKSKYIEHKVKTQRQYISLQGIFALRVGEEAQTEKKRVGLSADIMYESYVFYN